MEILKNISKFGILGDTTDTQYLINNIIPYKDEDFLKTLYALWQDY